MRASGIWKVFGGRTDLVVRSVAWSMNRIARVVGALFVAIADINARSPPVPFSTRLERRCEAGLRRCGTSPIKNRGVTALGLQRVLGLGSYQTAWTMLHRLRRAMIRPGRERLSGVVEVDECFVGHTPRQQKPVKKKGKKTVKQQDSGNTVIAVAVEIKLTKGFGRIRLSRIAAPSQVALMPFIKDSIEPGSIVHTDGSAAYRLLSKNGYRRMKTVMHGNEKPAHVSMPGVHRVASLLKRWLLGTHQGAIRPQQFDHYLDEFVFRFNRRTSRSRGLLFYRLLEQAILTEPLTYSQIAGGSKHKI